MCEFGMYDPLKAGTIDGTGDRCHDNGINRALNANYKPNINVKGNPECTLFIGRLDYSTSEEKLKEIFKKYGKIKNFRLVREIVTGHSKGYAFCEYETRRDADRAYKEANRLIIDNREIIIEHEYERVLDGWVPRRLGGGFGGRKESGQLRFGGRYKPFQNLFDRHHKKPRHK